MLDALAASTSDIPAVRRQLPAAAGLDMFGDTTGKAVQHGAWNAVAGAVDRAITTLRSNAYDPAVVLTGGDASRMLTALGTEPLHRPPTRRAASAAGRCRTATGRDTYADGP